jgi:hypothetical protein
MIYDALNTVSTAQTVTATAVSTDAIDLLQNREVADGQAVDMVFTTLVAALAAGAATVTFDVIIADDSALTTNVEVIGSSGPIGKADLVVGKQVPVSFNPQTNKLGRRYLGGRYTVATGPLTAGQFHAAIAYDVASGVKSYPTRITVA